MWLTWHDSYDLWTLGGCTCLSLQDLSHRMNAGPHMWGLDHDDERCTYEDGGLLPLEAPWHQ
jgi:hypothetical protein